MATKPREPHELSRNHIRAYKTRTQQYTRTKLLPRLIQGIRASEWRNCPVTDSLSCEDRKMRNLFTTFVISSTAGMMLVATLFAQQTPATSTQHLPAATTKKTTTSKRATAPTAKPRPVTLTTQQDKISYAIGKPTRKKERTSWLPTKAKTAWSHCPAVFNTRF